MSSVAVGGVEFRSAEENAISSRHFIQKLLYRREACLLRNLERRLCDRADYILTLSEDDRFALGIAVDDRSSAVPLMASREPRFPSPSPAANCDLALIGNCPPFHIEMHDDAAVPNYYHSWITDGWKLLPFDGIISRSRLSAHIRDARRWLIRKIRKPGTFRR